MTSTIALEYRAERAAQDARFDRAAGLGMVDSSLTGTEEYARYYGLGEFEGSGVEVRLTFKAYLIAKGRERRAEREAAERAKLAELPVFMLVQLAEVPAAAAELERRLAEHDDDRAFEPAFDVAAEVAEIADAPAEIVEILEAEIVAETLEAAEVVDTLQTCTAGSIAGESSRPGATIPQQRAGPNMLGTLEQGQAPTVADKPPYRGTRLHAVRVPDDVWNAAQARARADGDNLSDVLRDVLRAYGAGERYTLKART